MGKSQEKKENKALTVAQINNAQPNPAKNVYLFDERGLYLEITPKGGKRWRFSYRFAGTRKLISFGVYPEVSLKEARSKCETARADLRNGIDPSQKRQEQKLTQIVNAANTFATIGEAWMKKMMGLPQDAERPAGGKWIVGKGSKWNQKHSERVVARIENDLFPLLGKRPIAEITAPEMLAVLRRIEARGVHHTAHRARTEAEAIFQSAINQKLCQFNPAAGLTSELIAMPETEHFPAITKPQEFGDLLRALDSWHGSLVVRTALYLAPLLAVRPGELRTAEWKDVDWNEATWFLVLNKTKKNGAPDLIVPLSRQALAALQELHKLTGDGRYIFPTPRSMSRPLSDNAVLTAMRTLGIPADVQSGHGFRASFRTMAAEQLKFKPELLEMQIGHLVKWPNGRAYDRTEFLDERRMIMQKWADYCDMLRTQPDNRLVVMKSPAA